MNKYNTHYQINIKYFDEYLKKNHNKYLQKQELHLIFAPKTTPFIMKTKSYWLVCELLNHSSIDSFSSLKNYNSSFSLFSKGIWHLGKNRFTKLVATVD